MSNSFFSWPEGRVRREKAEWKELMCAATQLQTFLYSNEVLEHDVAILQDRSFNPYGNTVRTKPLYR